MSTLAIVLALLGVGIMATPESEDEEVAGVLAGVMFVAALWISILIAVGSVAS